MITSYQGFTYELDPKTNGWNLVFPHGQKLKAPPQSEEQLRAEIDKLHAAIEAEEQAS